MTPHHVTFFASGDDLRRWFAEHHEAEDELWVGYHRKASGRPSITWREAVDEALCVGWIDGVRYSLDETSFAQRFTPRRKGSNWSGVNVKRATELMDEGRMTAAGRAAFEARTPERTAVYSYEREHATFDEEQLERFRSEPDAWSFFESQSPSYRRAATYWVVSAKRPETRTKRFEQLLEDSRTGRRIRQLA
jgi:uncharacterized protein YdeI (YjbR/CyaY-like superfamily)